MNYKQSDQISRSRNCKNRNVASRRVQNIRDKFGDEHSADGARHSADADDRPDRLLRKHIRGERKDIRRPALMRSPDDCRRFGQSDSNRAHEYDRLDFV